jgi:carbonic anhydrase/acetyltransferase-like protein (isoleucine patch superfamily)
MGAIVLNNATIPPRSLVGAGALVTEGRTFPEGSLILGSPARSVRKLNQEEMGRLEEGAMRYISLARTYGGDTKSD